MQSLEEASSICIFIESVTLQPPGLVKSCTWNKMESVYCLLVAVKKKPNKLLKTKTCIVNTTLLLSKYGRNGGLPQWIHLLIHYIKSNLPAVKSEQ